MPVVGDLDALGTTRKQRIVELVEAGQPAQEIRDLGDFFHARILTRRENRRDCQKAYRADNRTRVMSPDAPDSSVRSANRISLPSVSPGTGSYSRLA